MNGMHNKMSGFTCCFCNQSIKENDIDPLDINITANCEIKKNVKDRAFQLFYSHFKCLQEKLHDNTKGYLIEIQPDD